MRSAYIAFVGDARDDSTYCVHVAIEVLATVFAWNLKLHYFSGVKSSAIIISVSIN